MSCLLYTSIKSGYRSSVLSIFDQIPAFLSRSERRVVMNRIEKGASFPKYPDTFFWLSDSMIANECFNCSDPVSYTHLDVYKRQSYNRVGRYVFRHHRSGGDNGVVTHGHTPQDGGVGAYPYIFAHTAK